MALENSPNGIKNFMNKTSKLIYSCGIIELFLIIFITILSRKPHFSVGINLTPFYSYLDFFKGDYLIGKQILLNIGLFIPIGFFLNLFSSAHFKKMAPRFIFPIIVGVFLSLAIENIQYIFKLGLFEIDDLISNSLGILLSYILYYITTHINRRSILNLISVMLILVTFLGCFFCFETTNDFADFNIQIASFNNNELTGYCFAYDTDNSKLNFSIEIQDISTNEFFTLDTKIHLPSDNIDAYYQCEYDYSNVGFRATVPSTINNFRIYVNWNSIGRKNTNLQACNGTIIYTDSSINSISNYNYCSQGLSDWILLANDTENDIFIFQKDDVLYWVVGPDFQFSNTNRTQIEYQLWTTQPDLLPEERRINNWNWDNMAFIFEDYEITNDFNLGNYRIAYHKLPNSYSVKYIMTGLYIENKWIYKICFRPNLAQLLDN